MNTFLCNPNSRNANVKRSAIPRRRWKFLQGLLFGLLLGAGSCALGEVTFTNVGSGLWTNTGSFNPGGEGTIQNVRYGTYKQNYIYNLGANTKQISDYNTQYVSSLAVNGIIFNGGDFTHNAENANSNPWWQVKISTSELSDLSSISSATLFQRLGYTDRLNNYTISLYTSDPTADTSASPVWTSDSQSTFPFFQSTALTASGLNSASEAWIRVTNQANSTANAILSLSEAQLFTDQTIDTYQSTTDHGLKTNGNVQYVPNNFVQTSAGTLSFDLDLSGASASYDTLDVAGYLTAGGTVNVNILNSGTAALGSFKLITAASVLGSFSKFTVSNVDKLDSSDVVLNFTGFNSNQSVTAHSMVHAKESAAANALWSDAQTWSSSDLANKDVAIGVYDSSAHAASSIRMNSEATVNKILLGFNPNSSGTLTLETGANLNVTTETSVGYFGSGTFNQTGGVFSTTAPFLAVRSNSGTVNLSGGSFSAIGGEQKNSLASGSGVTGVFNISGTAVAALSGIDIATGGASRGTLTVSETAQLTLADGSVRVGTASQAIGTFNQTGGTVTSNGSYMYLGDSNVQSAGIMNLSSGTMSVNNASLVVGTYGRGELNVSGTAQLNSNYPLIISYGRGTGSGTVNQTGGTVNLTADNSIQFGNDGTAATTGTYKLSGGTLNAKNILRKSGMDNVTAKLNITGDGVANVSGDISVPVEMTGGVLNASSISGTLTASKGTVAPGGLNAPGALTITGTVSLEGYTDLSVNQALNRTANQSSTYSSTFPASKAVNGNTVSRDDNLAHTSSSSGTNQFWEVQLDAPMTVDRITMYYRSGFDRRLVGNNLGYHFELYDGTIDNLGDMVWQSELYTTYTAGQTYDFDNPGMGQTVRLVRDFYNGYTPSNDDITINLTELQVFSADYIGPVLSLDVMADGQADKIVLGPDAVLNLENVVLEVNFEDPSLISLDDSWQLFEIDPTATVTGSFSNIILPDLPWGDIPWNTSDLLKGGSLSLSVPEPGSLSMILLGTIGMVLLLRRNNREKKI